VNNNSTAISNPKGQNQMTIAITATYSPEDNKLRLYASSRLDTATYERVKAAGFKWAPKQDLFVAPMWTPSREGLCIELAGEIGDEDTTLVERAEVKADRLEDLSTRRAQDGDRAQNAVHAIADGIPFGQPILVGHHSERHARKDAEKIENGMRRAVEMWKAAEYWKSRAKGAIRLAKYKERPDVRARRIKGLEASKRKEEKSQQEAEMWLKLWTACSQEQDKKLQAQVALRIAGMCHLNLARKERDKEGHPHTPSAYDALTGSFPSLYAPRTLDEVFTAALAAYPCRIEHTQRWIDHYTNRITYERAMLDDQGGTVAEQTGPEKGGAVRCWTFRGWSYIQKVNKVSVTVLDNWGNGGENFTRTVPFTDLKGVMTKAAVDAARAEGRLIESASKQGFSLLDPTPVTSPVPAPKPEPEDADSDETPAKDDTVCPDGPDCEDSECRAERIRQGITPTNTRDKIEQMQNALKAGVQVIAAPQLFPTPPALAERMVEEADILPGHCVLEPSAGTGSILAALPNVRPFGSVTAVEINATLAASLEQVADETICGDFLEQNGNLGTFDRIVMNPPFENGADIKHIQHAMKMLKPGGRLVAICANGLRQQSTLKPLAENSGGWYEDLPAGTFASQGTNVNTAILLIEN
jgi:protein-L-isoaspartate O-methyltransferase